MINTKLNRSDYLLLIAYSVAFVLIQLLDHTFYFDQTTYKFIRPDGSSYTQLNTGPSLEGYLVGVPTSLISILFIILILFRWLIPRYLIDRKNYFLFFMLAILVLVIFGIFNLTIWHWADHVPWEAYPSAFKLIMKSINDSASTSGLPLGILLTKKYFESQVQVAQIEKKQKESELKLLQTQINPHFLFNNLNTLDSLVEGEPEKAKRYIANLSALYRYLINTKDQEVVSLSEELSMIKNYFYLIEIRFGNVYTFDIISQSTKDGQYLPIGALQLLIENVVKHNRVLEGKAIKTTIAIEGQQVVVTNNKTNISENRESFGMGLNNLQERYALIFDKEIAVISNEFEFQVRIPLIELL